MSNEKPQTTPLIESQKQAKDNSSNLERAIVDEQTRNLAPYTEGQLLYFRVPAGSTYSIIIEKIEEYDITFRNTQEGCMSMTLPLKTAQNILESASRVR